MNSDHTPKDAVPQDVATSRGATPVTPLDSTTAALLDSHLRAIDTVRIRVLGDDASASRPVEAHLLAKGLGVEVSLAEKMIPPPLHRYVFRYQGRTAFLTIAPELP